MRLYTPFYEDDMENLMAAQRGENKIDRKDSRIRK